MKYFILLFIFFYSSFTFAQQGKEIIGYVNHIQDYGHRGATLFLRTNNHSEILKFAYGQEDDVYYQLDNINVGSKIKLKVVDDQMKNVLLLEKPTKISKYQKSTRILSTKTQTTRIYLEGAFFDSINQCLTLKNTDFEHLHTNDFICVNNNDALNYKLIEKVTSGSKAKITYDIVQFFISQNGEVYKSSPKNILKNIVIIK